MKPDLIRELYTRELDERHQQDSRTTTEVAVLTVMGGALIFYLSTFPPERTLLWLLFALCIGTSIICYSLAIILVLRANIGFKYERLPHARQMYEYYSELVRYYDDNPSARGSADHDFESYLCEKMIAATTRNAVSNIGRSERHYSASRFLAGVVVFALLAALPVILTLAGGLRSLRTQW
jgi:hypothetical protein